MVKTCGVEFINNPQKICFAGQKVFGRAFVLLDEPKTVKKLKLQIYGYSYVSWKDSDKDSHWDQITYIDTGTTLMEPKDKDVELTIEPGRHTFDFNFEIPVNCPSSFQGFHGHIRYLVKIIFVRPILNQTKVVPFTVMNPLNLNIGEVNLSLPIKIEKTKTLWFSKPIFMTASIPKTGYVPGEKIPVEIEVNNTSLSVAIKELVVGLLLVARYRTRTSVSTERETKVLTKVIIPSDEMKGKESTVTTFLEVPPTLPSSQDLCEIIKLEYIVQITARTSGMHLNADIAIPCVIGSIPLGAVTRGGTHSNNFEDYDMELPSYEEATFMSDVKPTQGDEMVGGKFVPFVPSFKNKS